MKKLLPIPESLGPIPPATVFHKRLAWFKQAKPFWQQCVDRGECPWKAGERLGISEATINKWVRVENRDTARNS